MKIVLTGGTGFIGTPLREKLLEKGHQVVLLTRNPGSFRETFRKGLRIENWDGKNPGAWKESLEGSDAVINLAGEPIAAKRWTGARKEKILKSRVEATRAIVSAISQARKKPAVLVNASAVGYYGDVPEGEVTEQSPRGSDFLAETCARWEEAATAAEPPGVRVVRCRIGIVLEKDGGALSKMLLPFRLYAGGPLGSGRQWFPWIHREDVTGAILFALENSHLSGPVNLAAPAPVTMKEFCKALGRALHRPSWAPAPAFVLRLLMGEMADLVLGGQRVSPKKLLDSGYRFRFPDLDGALAAIVKK